MEQLQLTEKEISFFKEVEALVNKVADIFSENQVSVVATGLDSLISGTILAIKETYSEEAAQQIKDLYINTINNSFDKD